MKAEGCYYYIDRKMYELTGGASYEYFITYVLINEIVVWNNKVKKRRVITKI